MEMDAVLSKDGVYRYTLTRKWAEGHRALFVMLNPSTADATLDDPTIRRCIGFAKKWGYGSIEVVNLFAFRATNPNDLDCLERVHGTDLIVGSDNERYWEEAKARASLVIAAWGAHVRAARSGQRWRAMIVFGDMDCLGRTLGNEPRHPLYLPGASRLMAWCRDGREVTEQ